MNSDEYAHAGAQVRSKETVVSSGLWTSDRPENTRLGGDHDDEPSFR